MQSAGLEKKHVSESESTPCMTYSAFEFFECDIAEEPYFQWYFKVIIIMHCVFKTYVTLSGNVTHHVTYFSGPGARVENAVAGMSWYATCLHLHMNLFLEKAELSVAQYINFVLLLGDLTDIIVCSFI